MKRDLASCGRSSDIAVASAGLEAEEGSAPPPEVMETMRGHGLDISNHRARPLLEEEVEGADLILTMAMHNSSRLITRHEDAVEKVFTLKEFVLQGEKKGRDLKEREPEKRLRELRGWIRRIEGWSPDPGGILNHQLKLFFLHYYHVYDHQFTIDDPLGQSMDFMRRIAEEIEDAVRRLLGPDVLAVSRAAGKAGESTGRHTA